MINAQYEVHQHSIQSLLTWLRTNAIVIPEIQRPFVWKSKQVRELIDSLYYGYPVGYLITWNNPRVRLKNGKESEGKRILIDGQQRVTALRAALLGGEIVDKAYKKKRIKIAFHPAEEKFEVTNPTIQGNHAWIDDIAKLFESSFNMLETLDTYCDSNSEANKELILERIARLKDIVNNNLGFIELNTNLKVETVSKIFVRINSQGAILNEADFAMSKMAAYEKYNGHLLRKCIDYFCHLSVAPGAYADLASDSEFAGTKYFKAMNWLKNETDDLYNPTYTDMLRVTFTSEFRRGRLDDLVALLSGRNFETREFEEVIAEDTFKRLDKAILRFMNEANFKRFVMILHSAGFVNRSMIRSQNAVNFAYIVYLTLRKRKINPATIEKLVSRWYVMSVLTGRYGGGFETKFGEDIRCFKEKNVQDYLSEVEQAELSDTFWNVGLPQRMNTSAKSSRYFNVFLASQVKGNEKGFLSQSNKVQTLLEHTSQVHHVFPQSYLKEHNFPIRDYNQIANYVVMQGEINIAIGNAPPKKYFKELWKQCNGGKTRYGGITDVKKLRANFRDHCLPEGMEHMNVDDYNGFLQKRRLLMSKKIRDYYNSL